MLASQKQVHMIDPKSEQDQDTIESRLAAIAKNIATTRYVLWGDAEEESIAIKQRPPFVPLAELQEYIPPQSIAYLRQASLEALGYFPMQAISGDTIVLDIDASSKEMQQTKFELMIRALAGDPYQIDRSIFATRGAFAEIAMRDILQEFFGDTNITFSLVHPSVDKTTLTSNGADILMSWYNHTKQVYIPLLLINVKSYISSKERQKLIKNIDIIQGASSAIYATPVILLSTGHWHIPLDDGDVLNGYDLLKNIWLGLATGELDPFFSLTYEEIRAGMQSLKAMILSNCAQLLSLLDHPYEQTPLYNAAQRDPNNFIRFTNKRLQKAMELLANK